jgi:hypothetical protein
MMRWQAPWSAGLRCTTGLAALCALCISLGECSSGPRTLVDRLPGNNEVGTWTRVSDIQLVTDLTAFYNRIDGGAPKFIDRGWVSSVYATYSDRTRVIYVAIYDMGSSVNAQSIYSYSMPSASQSISGRDNAVLDLGLSSVYAAYAYVDRFYIELNISDKSDTALDAIELFTNDILDRNR